MFPARPIIVTHLLIPVAKFKKAAGRVAAVVVPYLTLLMPAVAPIQKGGVAAIKNGGRVAAVVVSRGSIVTHLLMPVANLRRRSFRGHT